MPGTAGGLAVPWDEYISREHATMQVEGKQLRVTRLGSGKNPITFRMKPVDTALVSPGESFVIGETTFEVIEDPLQAGRRTATCTAVDFVQLVRIKAEDFALMMERVSGSGRRHHGGGRAPAARWTCNSSAACSRHRSPPSSNRN